MMHRCVGKVRIKFALSLHLVFLLDLSDVIRLDMTLCFKNIPKKGVRIDTESIRCSCFQNLHCKSANLAKYAMLDCYCVKLCGS